MSFTTPPRIIPLTEQNDYKDDDPQVLSESDSVTQEENEDIDITNIEENRNDNIHVMDNTNNNNNNNNNKIYNNNNNNNDPSSIMYQRHPSTESSLLTTPQLTHNSSQQQQQQQQQQKTHRYLLVSRICVSGPRCTRTLSVRGKTYWNDFLKYMLATFDFDFDHLYRIYLPDGRVVVHPKCLDMIHHVSSYSSSTYKPSSSLSSSSSTYKPSASSTTAPIPPSPLFNPLHPPSYLSSPSFHHHKQKKRHNVPMNALLFPPEDDREGEEYNSGYESDNEDEDEDYYLQNMNNDKQNNNNDNNNNNSFSSQIIKETILPQNNININNNNDDDDENQEQQVLNGRNCDIESSEVKVGDQIEVLYDFGDEWQFMILVQDIHDELPFTDNDINLVSQVGRAPQQYDIDVDMEEDEMNN